MSPKDESFKDRRRRDEREAEQSDAVSTRKAESRAAPRTGDSKKIEDILRLLPGELEALDGLYRMYLMGVEKRPPFERRARVDRDAAELPRVASTQAGLKFRAQTLHASYRSHLELWERILKEKEKK